MTAKFVKSDPMQHHTQSDRSPARIDAEAAALDIWLHRSLAARYDATLSERLPDDMLDLLGKVH